MTWFHVKADRPAGRLLPPERVCPGPLITGADLLAMGTTEGSDLGRVLKRVYDAQLNEHIQTPAEAKALARERADGQHA